MDATLPNNVYLIVVADASVDAATFRTLKAAAHGLDCYGEQNGLQDVTDRKVIQSPAEWVFFLMFC